MTTLWHERGAAEGAGSGGGSLIEERVQGLVALAKKTKRNGRRAWDDPVIRDKVMKIVVRAAGLGQAFRRARVEGLIEDPMRIPLQGKVLMSELMQDAAQLGVEIEGALGSLYIADGRAPTKA